MTLILPGQGAMVEPDRSSVPAGMMMPFGGAITPDGWLLCNGASVLVVDYPALHAAIGYAWGGAAANFNLPDMVGRMPVGVGTLGSEVYALAATGGEAFHTLVEAELAIHGHPVGTLVNANQSASHDHNAGQLASNNQSASHNHGLNNHNHTLPNHVHPIPHDHTALAEVTDASVGGASQRVRSTGSGLSVGNPTNANSSNPTSNPNGGGDSGNTTSQQASHSHTITGDTGNQNTAHQHSISGSVADAGSDTAHENRPAFGAVNYLIKA